MSNVKLLDDSKSLPVLASDATNGLGILQVNKCTVTEELNGIYECQFEIPVTDKHYSEIHAEGIVKIKPSEGQSEQMFRIYHISKPMNGIVTVSGHHITYDLNKVAVKPCSATGASLAMNTVKNNVLGTYPFTVYTNITNTSSKFQIKEPRSFRACLGGSEGSLLDVFGGEYQWDNLQVRLLSHRGNDNGVSIEYGKNLMDIKQEENIENTYTAVLGYATSDDTTVTGTLQYAVQTDSPKTLIIDFSSEFQGTTPTVAQINTLAQQYIQRNDIGVPNVNITVRFAPLWQTEEYKNIATLERVALGDTVHVKFARLGVEATAKVIKTVYNVLLDRYESIEIGDVRSSLSRTLLGMEQATNALNEQMKNAVTASFMDAAIENATNLITGGLGGHVVISKNAAGEPEEILIMNTADKATATQVIRINKNGIGFGTSYNGPFETAWTIDGKFVADYIASGTINAIDIVGSLIKGATIVFGTDDTKTVTASGDSGGVEFKGTGRVRFRNVGEFSAVNYIDDNYSTKYNQLAMGKYSDSTGEYTSSEVYNYNSNGVAANYIDLMSYSTGTKSNIFELGNNSKNGTNVNLISLRNNDSESITALRNYSQNGTLQNKLSMEYRANGASYAFFENYIGGALRSRVNLYSDMETNTKPRVAISNYDVDGSSALTQMFMTEEAASLFAYSNRITTAYVTVKTDGNVSIRTDGAGYSLKWITFYDRDGVYHRVLGPQ